jgi:hypothetical protein
LIASCTASAEDVRPPEDKLFFPSGLAVTPPGNTAKALFIANSNSELRFDSGSIAVVSLDRVRTIIDDWAKPARIMAPGCEDDPEHRETLVCDTVASELLRKGAGVRIGNFATDIAVQDFTPRGATDGVKLRVIVPTRGDPSIAWADYDGDKLSCSDEEGFAQCDDAHRLASMLNDPDERPIQDEPFNVFAATQPADPLDPAGKMRGFAVVTHLTTGGITLIDAPEDGAVQLSDVVNGLFLGDVNALFGSTGVAGIKPGGGENAEDLIYVGSRTENRIQTLTVGRPENRTHPYLLPASHFFLEAVGQNQLVGGSIDTRGLRFSPDGKRLYVVNRRPPTLQIYDTSLGPTGVPRNAPLGASDICRQASSVAVMETGTVEDPQERAYVTCFQDGQVYVVDPAGQSMVEDIITVGRGPYAVAAAPDQKLVFVSNVLEDTIAVIDVEPTSPKRNRVVLRIGVPRTP